MKLPVCTLGAALLALCLGISAARANVLIAGTRVVFPARDGEVTVRLTNNNDKPALVEAWIDRGDEHSTPDKVDTPFLITPPLFRMEPHRDQNLRILYTHEQLPADRESLFWLNVLEVPPKPGANEVQDKNYLQLAIRSRLKLFYRPDGLPGDPAKAPAQLTFRATVDAGHGGALSVHNPTAYYVTILKAEFQVDGQTYTVGPGMVEPLGDLRMPVPQFPHPAQAGAAVRFDTINDYGAVASNTAVLMP